MTPGRLALHETALVGLQLKAALEHGSFDDRGQYYRTPSGASELDLQQDLFAALRVTERGQAALLLPLVESRRVSSGLDEFGGGLGDLNLNVRYDFTRAGEARWLPGIGLLAGLTLPTGTPPDSPRVRPLATDATGIGAFQGSFGLALEQAFGPWLISATGIAAKRSARQVMQGGAGVHEQLAAQWTLLLASAYVFESEAALALSAAYAVEGEAEINGRAAPGSAHRTTTLTVSGLLPLSDQVRMQGALFVLPPVSQFSANQLGTAGLQVAAVYAWQ